MTPRSACARTRCASSARSASPAAWSSTSSRGPTPRWRGRWRTSLAAPRPGCWRTPSGILRGGVSAGGLSLLSALDALKFLLPPVDAWLKERGAEGAVLLRAHAERLDARVRSGAVLEDSVLLATLLLPLLRSPPPAARPDPVAESTGESTAAARTDAEEAGPAVPPAIEDLLQELVRTARLPRRIAERCRMILLAQATLTGQRRRRGGLASFRRHPLFQEALTVFELSVEATGEHRAELEAWRSGGAPTPAAAGPSPEGGRRRRRRRRRGPRAGSPPGAGS